MPAIISSAEKYTFLNLIKRHLLNAAKYQSKVFEPF